MHFAFTSEQEELKRGARRFLAQASTSSQVRAAMATESGFDPATWRRIADELGWPSLIIPEEYGGAGFGYVELAAVMEEAGRALLGSPFFSSVCLGANAILAAGTSSQKSEVLPQLASGEATATLALAEASGRWDAESVSAIARPDARGGYRLSGKKSYVVDGHTADLLVVAARREGSRGDEGVGLFVVAGEASGVSRRHVPTMDATRKLAEITLRDVRVAESAALGEDALDAGAAIALTVDRACIALSAEQVGGAEKCLDIAVDYAKTRVQFGRAIGSFQAIKHKLADALLLVESARSASYYAAWAASHGPPGALAAAAPIAKAYCSDAYFECASECIQVHGGIGFTWEHDAHLYFKRAKSSESFFGDAALHRERVARQIL